MQSFVRRDPATATLKSPPPARSTLMPRMVLPQPHLMSDVPKSMKAPDAVMQGYMLKKKRKKMQGMAKRYFWLSPSGALSYSFNPTSPVRDSLLVNLAYVSANRKSRTFHIDSGKTVYHCKTFTIEEFDKWTEALKAFSGTVLEHEHQNEQVLMPSSFQVAKNEAGGAVDLAAISVAVSQMSAPLKDLETLSAELRQHMEVLSPSPINSPGTKLKFFKKHGKESSSSIPTRQASDDYFEAKPMNNDLLFKQYEKSVAALRQQHEALTAAIRAAPSSTGTSEKAPGAASPMKTYASRSSAAFYGNRASMSRASSFSIGSNDDEDFYDAVPGEFVLEEDDLSSDDEPTTPGESTLDDDDDSDDEETDADKGSDTSPEPEATTGKASSGNVQRRAKLPAPAGDEFSMLGLLRKNVGKDLSQISFPVSMNEPLSALQRIAEELEYSKLLDDAAKAEDPVERLTLVATFAISACSSNKYRSSRKPFNPLLGETYECIRPDRDFKFIAEKVSHNPVVMAFHSDGKAWKLDGYAAPSQKFWGRSMEVNVSGDYKISFPDKQEVYSIRKPASFVRNLVAGTKYLEIVGDLVVEDESSGSKAVINFKEGSAWGGSSTRNKIEGKVTDGSGKTRVELAGRWDEHVDKKEGGSKFTRLWQINDFPSNPERYYGFSRFSTELNEKTALDEQMAPSDSRLRPDQLAMENGDIDKAEELKKQLEEKQRAKRKDGKLPDKPAWFVQEGDSWKYNGAYFDKREKQEFEDPDIFISE